MNDYEKFVKTTDLKVDADDDVQFYLDGYNEEHGEISGVIKRMRRGDYDSKNASVSLWLITYGLKSTLLHFDKCREDLLKEIGDEHWYLTRFLQVIGISWNQVEQLNMMKLKKRHEQGQIMGSGSNREDLKA